MAEFHVGILHAVIAPPSFQLLIDLLNQSSLGSCKVHDEFFQLMFHLSDRAARWCHCQNAVNTFIVPADIVKSCIDICNAGFIRVYPQAPLCQKFRGNRHNLLRLFIAICGNSHIISESVEISVSIVNAPRGVKMVVEIRLQTVQDHIPQDRR